MIWEQTLYHKLLYHIWKFLHKYSIAYVHSELLDLLLLLLLIKPNFSNFYGFKMPDTVFCFYLK
jgi:hypothetical protein